MIYNNTVQKAILSLRYKSLKKSISVDFLIQSIVDVNKHLYPNKGDDH